MVDYTSWLIGKDSDAGRDWGQKEKGITEDEMAGWHHWLAGPESEWTPGVGDGQGGLACCDSWGRKESDMTEQLNWTELTQVRYTNRMLPFQTDRFLLTYYKMKKPYMPNNFKKASKSMLFKLQVMTPLWIMKSTWWVITGIFTRQNIGNRLYQNISECITFYKGICGFVKVIYIYMY